MKKYIWVFILVVFNTSASAGSVDVESSDNSISINNGHISIHSSGDVDDSDDYEDRYDSDDYDDNHSNGSVVIDDDRISIDTDNIDVDID